MKTYKEKDRIGFWLRLYNRLEEETYSVESWPDDDSSKPNIDALCRNAASQTLAVETAGARAEISQDSMKAPCASSAAYEGMSGRTIGIARTLSALAIARNFVPSMAIYSPRIRPQLCANRTNCAPAAVTASRCIRRNSAIDL